MSEQAAAGITVKINEHLDMVLSEPCAEIAAALSVAQLEIVGAPKDSKNPHFKSAYATLASVWEACHGALNKQGIAIVQAPAITSDGGQILITLLLHKSGQWIRGVWKLKPVKDDPQGMGSAVTYARRYSLSAMTGVAPVEDDDDGNAASGHERRGGSNWDKLQDDDPPSQKPDRGPIEFAQVTDSTDSLPEDIAGAKRELQQFAGKKFAELQDADVNAIGRQIEDMASKTKSQNNRVALTVLAAIIRNEQAKRKGAA